MVRAIAGLLPGLLAAQLLGDEVVARRWEELPEVLASCCCHVFMDPLVIFLEVFNKEISRKREAT